MASFLGGLFAKAYITADAEIDVECSELANATETKRDAAKQWLLYETSLDTATDQLAGTNQSSLILPGTPSLLRCYCMSSSSSLFASLDDVKESFEDVLREAAVELSIPFTYTEDDWALCEQLCVRAYVRVPCACLPACLRACVRACVRRAFLCRRPWPSVCRDVRPV